MYKVLIIFLALCPNYILAQTYTKQTLINKSAELIIDEKDYHQVLESVDRFINSINTNNIDSTVYDNNYFNKEKSLFFVINNNIQKSGLSKDPHFYKPIINYAERIDSNYLIKVAFIAIDSTQTPILKQVQTFLLKRNNYALFNVYSPLLHHIRNWKTKKVGPITYQYEHFFDKNKAQKMISSSIFLSKLLNVPIQEVTYYKFKDSKDLFDQIGTDYIHNKYWSNKGGFVIDKNIFAGNNSELYVHELVHIYTRAKTIPDKNLSFWADEGLATYLGGSGEYSYKELLKILKQRDLRNRDLLRDLHDVYATDIVDNFPIGYALNALLIENILAKRNKKIIDFLYNEGDFASYLNLLEEHLNIKKDNLYEGIMILLAKS